MASPVGRPRRRSEVQGVHLEGGAQRHASEMVGEPGRIDCQVAVGCAAHAPGSRSQDSSSRSELDSPSSRWSGETTWSTFRPTGQFCASSNSEKFYPDSAPLMS